MPAHVDVVVGTGVDVHLDRRGVAHHRAAGRPRGVEVLLHRRVPRLVQHTRDLTADVDARTDEVDAGGPERVAHRRGVGAHGVDRGAEGSGGWTAQLELTTG